MEIVKMSRDLSLFFLLLCHALSFGQYFRDQMYFLMKGYSTEVKDSLFYVYKLLVYTQNPFEVNLTTVGIEINNNCLSNYHNPIYSHAGFPNNSKIYLQ
jgi:hypothetical protein